MAGAPFPVPFFPESTGGNPEEEEEEEEDEEEDEEDEEDEEEDEGRGRRERICLVVSSICNAVARIMSWIVRNEPTTSGEWGSAAYN
jgi:hypothetical protein